MSLPNGSTRRRYILACINAELDGRRIFLQRPRSGNVNITVETPKPRPSLKMVCQWPYSTRDKMRGSFHQIELAEAIELIEDRFSDGLTG